MSQDFAKLESYMLQEPDAQKLLLSIYKGTENFQQIVEDVTMGEMAARKVLSKLEKFKLIKWYNGVNGDNSDSGYKLTEDGESFKKRFYEIRNSGSNHVI